MGGWESTGRWRGPPTFSQIGTTRSSDAGSFFFDPAGDNDGFESPEAAAEWTRTQTRWPELDLSDGYAVAIVLGSEFKANQAAWEAWEGRRVPRRPACT